MTPTITEKTWIDLFILADSGQSAEEAFGSARECAATLGTDASRAEKTGAPRSEDRGAPVVAPNPQREPKFLKRWLNFSTRPAESMMRCLPV